MATEALTRSWPAVWGLRALGRKWVFGVVGRNDSVANEGILALTEPRASKDRGRSDLQAVFLRAAAFFFAKNQSSRKSRARRSRGRRRCARSRF